MAIKAFFMIAESLGVSSFAAASWPWGTVGIRGPFWHIGPRIGKIEKTDTTRRDCQSCQRYRCERRSGGARSRTAAERLSHPLARRAIIGDQACWSGSPVLLPRRTNPSPVRASSISTGTRNETVQASWARVIPAHDVCNHGQRGELSCAGITSRLEVFWGPRSA